MFYQINAGKDVHAYFCDQPLRSRHQILARKLGKGEAALAEYKKCLYPDLTQGGFLTQDFQRGDLPQGEFLENGNLKGAFLKCHFLSTVT